MSKMSPNLQQSNSISLSAIFNEIVHSIKSSLISDPKIFFNDAAYKDCLIQLGKFLSLIESSIAIKVDLPTSQSPVLISYANSLNKSIKILKHSIWFLQLVPAVENEKKFSVFENGIDIFNSAVSIIDETIKIFFSDKVISLLQKELQSNLLCLYDRYLKVLPFLSTATTEVHSNSVSIPKALITKETGNNSDSFEPANVLQKIDPLVTTHTNVLNNELSSRENCIINANTILTPICSQEKITFSDLGHKKRFDQLCKRIKDDINYFAIVKSKKLKLKCLLCDFTVSASKVENHVIQIGHLHAKSRAPCFNTISNLAVRTTWNFTQNSAVTPVSYVNALKSDSSSSSEYPCQISEKVPGTLGNIPESSKPFSQTSNIKNITFTDPSHKKRFDEICSSIKDEVYNFNIVKSKKLRLLCLLCNRTMLASKVEDHVIEASHLHERSKALCLNTESDSALSTNCSIAQNNLVTPVPCIGDSKLNLSFQFSGNPSRRTDEVLAVSENIHKSCNPSDFSQKTILNVLERINPSDTNQSFFKKSLINSSALISIPLEKDFIFLDRAHKKRFKEICKNIKDEVNYFKIIKSKQLKFLCLFCDQTIPASKVEHHIIEMSHLRKKSKILGFNAISDSTSSSNCDTAQTNSVSLESNSSIPDSAALPNSLGNLKFTGKASEVETAENIPRPSKPSNSSPKTGSNSSNFPNILNTNQSSSKKELDSMNRNTPPNNPVIPESVSSIPVTNLQSDLSKKSSSNMTQNAGLPKNIASSGINPNSNLSCNFKPISYEENFTLSKHEQKQFDNLCGIIGCQINYFLVRGSKGLKLTCLLCNQTMEASNVIGHVNQQGHLLSVSLQKSGPSSVPEHFSEKVVELSEENKQFLVYFPRSRDFVCTLCNLVLVLVKDKWFEHFQTKYHNARLSAIDSSRTENEFVTEFQCNSDQEVAINSAFLSHSKIVDQATSESPTDMLTTQKQENSSVLTGAVCQVESKLPQFAQSSHKKEFFRLKEKINAKIENFSVHSEPNQKRLKMTCNLCKKCLQASYVETHIKEREHSQHVIASQVKEEYKKYLEFCPSDRGYRCIVCKETFFGNNNFVKVLWHGHFESETHLKNEKKLSSSIPSFLNAQANPCVNSPTKSAVVPVKEETITDLKSEEQNFCNEGKGNPVSSQNYISTADILPATTISFNSHQSFNLDAFQFSKYSHSTEFVSLIKQINNQVAYFTVISLVESEKLKLRCRPCNKSISAISKAVEHVNEQDHLLNKTKYRFCASVWPAISNQDWSFLKPRPVFKDYFCLLCNEQLLNKFSSWVEHFLGKSHRSKSQIVITSNSKRRCSTESSSVFGNSTVNNKKFNDSKPSCSAELPSVIGNPTVNNKKFSSPKRSYITALPSVSGNSAVNDKKFIDSKMQSRLSKQSTAVDSNFTQNYGNISVKIKNSSKSTSRVIFALSTSTSNFPRFKQRSHVMDYHKRQDKVKYHKKLFSITGDETKKKHILVCCNLCNKEMSVNNIVAHMDSKTHLHSRNSKEIWISEENRMFLDHRSGRCTLCNVPLHHNQHLWLQHFQSEFHNNLKSQLHAKKKDTISEAMKIVEPSDFSKTNINSSLQSNERKQRLCHSNQSTAINSEFVQNFINIFTETDFFKSASIKADPSEFKQSSHAQQYVKLCNEIKGQIKHFSIVSDQKKKELEMMCKLCNKLIAAKIVKCHITSLTHLRSLIAPFVSKENRMFFHDVISLRCLLCNVRLYKDECLWFKHFQSQSHTLKLKKYNDDYWSSRVDCGLKEPMKCDKFEVDHVESTNCVPWSHPVSDTKILKAVTDENNAISWITNNQPNAKLASSAKNQRNFGTSPENVILNEGLSCAKKSEIIFATSCKTVGVSSIQNDRNPSESVKGYACKNVSSNSETFKTPDNLVENQERKDFVPETIKRSKVIIDQSSRVKTNILSSLESSLACKQELSHAKQSTTIDIYFAQNYVNIFAKHKSSLDLTSSDTTSEIQFKISSSEFKEDSHKKEYDFLSCQIGGQIRHFVINSAPQKKLKLMCKICNKLMSVKRAVSHVTCMEHLVNLMAPFMNEESKMYLGCSKTVFCTLCDITLYKNQCLWFEHFQSELHNLKLQEHHDDFWSLKVDSYSKLPEECEKINADCGMSTNYGHKQSNLLDDLGLSDIVSCEDSATGLKSNLKLPVKFGSSAKNDEKENLSGIENHANLLESASESACENISSNLKTFKTCKNVTENGRKFEGCASETMKRAESITHKSNSSMNSVRSSLESFPRKELTLFKKSATAYFDFAQNYVNIFAKAKVSSDSTSVEAFKLSLPEFKQDAHKRQYDALHGQIGDQIRYFSFKSAPQKKLRMTCMLCIRSMNVKKAPSHVTCNDHLRNLMAPFTSKENKMYLGNNSKTICCTLCDVPLYINHCLWFEHFQSEFHFSKLQEHHNDYWNLQVDSYSKTSEESENFGNGLNVNFKLGTKLGTSAKNEKNDSLSGVENRASLPEARTEGTSNSSARASSSKYVYDLSNLKFAQYLHSIQFVRLIQKVTDQVKHFSFESHPESRDLKFFCKVCNESFTNADMVATHVKMQEHKLNLGLFNSKTLGVPTIRECSWMFLKPCLSSKGFRCTWCNVKLSSEFDEWMDHFQSESHNAKLERPPISSNLSSGINFKSNSENSENSDYKQGNGLSNSNPSMNSEVLPAAKKKASNFIAKVNDITPELCTPPPIPLKSALESDFIQSTKKFDKEKLKTLMAELDFQVNFFLIYSTKFEGGRLKLICKLCASSLGFHKVADHAESRNHLENMIIPLISRENKMYLQWCFVTRNYTCSLCRITLSRGMCLFEHFLSDAHLLKLQELNVDDGSSKSNHGVEYFTKSEDFKFNEELTRDCLPTPVRSSYSIVTPVKHSDLSAEINALSRIKKTLKLYRNRHIFNFLHLACSVEDQINFFSFEAGPEDLNMVCQLCKVSFTNVEFAIDHVRERKHAMNVEKNKSEVTVVPWIPSVCDDNWKFLWPFPDQRNYFCTVCNKVLPKPILSWVHHFRSKSHNQKLRELHQDLLTVETCFLSNGNKDKDWALGALAPENLFQDSFNLEALQFSSVAHKIQFENLAKKINYQINYFSISVQKQSKELILTCKLCNETVFVSEVEEHVNEQKHLLNLAVKCERKSDTYGSEISQDDWQYLDFNTSSQEYVCTLCDVKLFISKESWAEHFQSKLHRLLAAEPQSVETEPLKEEFVSGSVDCSDTCPDNREIRKVVLSKNYETAMVNQNSVDSCVNGLSSSDRVGSKSDDDFKNCLERTEKGKSIMNELCLTDSDRSKSTNQFEKFINKCEEFVLKLSSPEIKKAEKPKFVFNLSSTEIEKQDKPKEFFDLSSVFKFFKIEDYFTAFFDLSRADKRSLKENCRFILIDEESQEVFCTACHCFNSVKNEPRSLKNLIGHFNGSQHQNNSHFYGPSAFFQYNVSLIKCFNGKTGFCSLCSVTIPCCLPADVDLLLDHFESQKHAGLVCKMYERESACVENECVTLVLNHRKN